MYTIRNHSYGLKLVTLSLLVTLCLGACSRAQTPAVPLASETPQEQPSPTLWPTQATLTEMPTIPYEEYKLASQEEVAHALLTKWIDPFLAEDTDPRFRLTDYHIDSVVISDKWKCRSKYNAKSIVDALISLQTPPDQLSHWWAGAGPVERNNWVINYYTIAIQVNGDVYQMQILGNPPCSPGEED